MVQSKSLLELLKSYLKRAVDRPAMVGYLTFRPLHGLWGFYDSTIVNDVWNAASDPGIIVVLRLEPTATAALVETGDIDNVEAVLTRFATFNAGRPHAVGLHHFVEVDKPESLQDGPNNNNGEAIN